MSLDQNVPIVHDTEHAETSKFFVRASGKFDNNTMHDISSLLARNVDKRKLPTELKMHIIQFEHPVESTLYPTTMMNYCLRRFEPPWLLEHPWFHYRYLEGIRPSARRCCRIQLDENERRRRVFYKFSIIFTEIKKLGAKVSVELTVPRNVGRQTQRANTPSTNAEENFRRTVMIPLLDRMTTELGARFGDNHRTVIQLLCLVPACIASSEIGFRIAVPEKLLELVATYKCDLLAPDLFNVEYVSWVCHWQQNKAHGTLPNTLQETILQCDSDRYRNIFMLLKIALTMLITTCENERSHSQVKLVKTI